MCSILSSIDKGASGIPKEGCDPILQGSGYDGLDQDLLWNTGCETTQVWAGEDVYEVLKVEWLTSMEDINVVNCSIA